MLLLRLTLHLSELQYSSFFSDIVEPETNCLWSHVVVHREKLRTFWVWGLCFPFTRGVAICKLVCQLELCFHSEGTSQRQQPTSF